MNSDPTPPISPEELNAVQTIESLPLDGRFDKVMHEPEHLIMHESSYASTGALHLDTNRMSEQLVGFFGNDSDHTIDDLLVEQTVMSGQYTTTLTFKLDGLDYTVTTINNTATLSYTSNATLKRITRRCSSEFAHELLAGIILSEAEDPNSVMLRPPLLDDDNADKTDGFSQALAKLSGNYALRVTSKFEDSDDTAMFTVYEEREGPHDMELSADLNIGYLSLRSPLLTDANYIQDLQLIPNDHENATELMTLSALSTAIGNYVLTKEIGLVKPDPMATIDKNTQPRQWAEICVKFHKVIQPLLDRYNTAG